MPPSRPPRPPSGPRRVVLVHGLWMVGGAMRGLGVRLRAAGFAPETFGYRSLAGGPEAAARALGQRLQGGEPAHVVAHSLGGLVALEALAAMPSPGAGRLVCLGVPLAGSCAAVSLSQWPLVPLWLGRSAPLLRRGCAAWPADVEVGMVAGNVPHGLGALFAHFAGEHDGTVAVSETRDPRLAAHVVVPSSHSGLIFSAAAAREVIGFLRHGRFGGDPAGEA